MFYLLLEIHVSMYVIQVVGKCKELGEVTQTFGYVVADMMDLNSTGSVIKVSVCQFVYFILFIYLIF